jgi:hypothetical protein
MSLSVQGDPAVQDERPPLRLLTTTPEQRPRAEISRVWPYLAVASAVGLGLLIRGAYVLSADFPLNDGGLFYAMIEDLQHSNYMLPQFTSYNSAEIPFAYPPLAIYAASILADASHLTAFDVLRFLPLAVNTITIAAFFLLARSLLSSRGAAIAAVFAFALLPRSFMWMIMGGGLTRSFGFLFAILALHQAHLLYTRRDKRFLLSTTVFASLTLLSHTEMAWFLAFSAAFMFLAYGRNRQGAVGSLLTAVGVLAMTAPWWATIIVRHGVSPLLAAGGSRSVFSGHSLVTVVGFDVSDEPMFAVLAFLGALGALACLADRKFFLPVWLVGVGLATPWILPTVATVPLALLVGIGVTSVLVPLLSRPRGLLRPLTTLTERAGDIDVLRARPSWLLTAVLGFIICYSTLSAFVVTPDLLASLSTDERAAMQWVTEHTPQSSEFLVITGERWWRDRTSEWFPVLAERSSVATTQGLEWIPNRAFQRQLDAYEDAQACAIGDTACLENWRRETGETFTHVYVSKQTPQALDRYDLESCCGPLQDSLLRDSNYVMVHDSPGASIFARLSQ